MVLNVKNLYFAYLPRTNCKILVGQNFALDKNLANKINAFENACVTSHSLCLVSLQLNKEYFGKLKSFCQIFLPPKFALYDIIIIAPVN